LADILQKLAESFNYQQIVEYLTTETK